MNQIAQTSPAERAEIFTETADRKDLPEAIVEKDFWVCWILKQLFSIEDFSGRLLFKGGTSLSKIFHAINRFSEDIDLAVDYAALGFTDERDPRRHGISKTRRTNILAEMMVACQQYVAGSFLKALMVRCREVLGDPTTWSLDVSPQDPNVVQFHYPAAGVKSASYIAPQVVLELGTHAEFVPRDNFIIQTFISEEFPDLVPDKDIRVTALLGKRTFWEKVTILHAEYHRPPVKPLPERYSRHYYDVAMLAAGKIRTEALADMTLLAQVVRHKETFYPSAWARYNLAQPRTLRLLPPNARIAALERDYRSMGVMIFSEPPPFKNVMDSLASLEEEINR